MKFKNKEKLLISTILSVVSIGALSQTASAQTVEDEIIVTGSRFTSPNIVSSSPVTTIDESAFERVGVVDAIDVLNRLPGVTAAQDSNVSNGATGTSTINLRGLGTERNLVLINGKRLGPGTPQAPEADLNQIPTVLLERVDVVTGGASAVYGSDAIAGVTNFILKDDFEGLELNTTFGFFHDSNSSSFSQTVNDLTDTDGISPTNSQTDGFTYDISAAFGASIDNDRGHITAYARYVDQGAVLQGGRDISRCAILDFGPVAGDDVFCAGSNFGPFPTTLSLPTIFESDADGNTLQFLANEDGDFVDAAGNVIEDAANAVLAPAGFDGDTIGRQQVGTASGTVSLDVDGNFTLGDDGNGAGASNPFNFNPLNFFQRPTERIQGGFFVDYEVSENVEAYLDATFFRNVTDAQVAPSATFGEVSEINCDNPFLTPELLATICTDRGFALDETASVQINRRFVEAGPRNSRIELDNIRLVGGFRGQIGNSEWDYDVFGQFATTSQTITNTNDANIELLNEALQAVDGPNGPECASGRDGCVPLNLFGTGPVDPAALAAVFTPTVSSGEVTQEVLGATIRGEVSQWTSPLSSTPVNLLFGVEYRRDALQSQPDSILLVGGATGLGGPEDPVDGESEVVEFYAETNIPLIEDQAFAQNLSLTGQFRYSDYSYDNDLPGGLQSDGFTTEAFSIGASWTPIDDIRIRAQFQRAVRAPNVFDLFAPDNIVLFDDSDPCSGAVGSDNLTATAAQCALTGLPTSLFGAVPEDAGQLNELNGGNVALQPEESDTFTIGAIIQPRFVEGLTLSVDYYDISIDDFITSIPAPTLLDQCLDGTQPSFCDFINRDDLGTIQIDGFIAADLLNIAERVARGIDIAADYRFDFRDWGDFNVNYVGNIVTALEQTSFPGAPVTDSNGLFGGSTFTDDANPEYRHVVNLGWVPNDILAFNLAWRHIGSVDNDGDVPEEAIGATFASENFFDIFGQWNAHEKLSFTAGVNNFLDNDPPVSDFRFTANGNTFPSTYDAAGRYIFLGAQLNF